MIISHTVSPCVFIMKLALCTMTSFWVMTKKQYLIYARLTFWQNMSVCLITNAIFQNKEMVDAIE